MTEYMAVGEVIGLEADKSYEPNESRLMQGTIVKVQLVQTYVGKAWNNDEDIVKRHTVTVGYFVRAGVPVPQVGDMVKLNMITIDQDEIDDAVVDGAPDA